MHSASLQGLCPGRAARLYGALWRYFLTMLFGNLAWEAAQLPLYTVWKSGSPQYLAFTVAHCTAGDLLIGATSLGTALALFGSRAWPARRDWRAAAATILGAVGYTLYSEWTNVYVRGSWAYSEAMPLFPGIGIGLFPILQWVVIPAAGFAWIQRAKGIGT